MNVKLSQEVLGTHIDPKLITHSAVNPTVFTEAVIASVFGRSIGHDKPSSTAGPPHNYRQCLQGAARAPFIVVYSLLFYHPLVIPNIKSDFSLKSHIESSSSWKKALNLRLNSLS